MLLKIPKYLFNFLLVIYIAIPFSGLAQTSGIININVSNQPIKELLKQIELQTQFTFVYSNTEIDVERLISYNAKNKPFTVILNEVFREQGIKFQILGNHIVLTRQAVQQEEPTHIKISGLVFDARDSLPLLGVNVLVKNTTIGTVTNSDGEFNIIAPEQTNTLIFSFVGYTIENQVVLGNARLIVYLNENPHILDEVVTYGYGRDSKKLISSAISSIKSDRLRDFVAPIILESLKGKLTGLTVCKNSGTPGGAMTVRIRGISSITAGADPLYVVDGVPFIAQDLSLIIFSGQGVNTISDINPFDVESISILKDASATAIYGARGSNGVILITTNRGITQKPQIRFDMNHGLQEVAKTYKMLNAEQFMRLQNEATINDGGTAIYTEEHISNNTIDVDWQDLIYRVAPTNNYNLSITGGNRDVNYFFSGHYHSQNGIVIGTDFKKYGARFNIDQKINERLSLGSSLSLNSSTNNRKEGDQSLNSPVSMALSRYPIYPIYNANGTYNDDGPYANPLSIAMQHTNLAYNWRAFGNVFANYRISKNLTYAFKYGFDYVNFREHTFDPPSTRQGAKYQGLGIESTSEVQKSFVSNIAKYSKNLTEKQSIDALIGYEFEKEKRSSTYLRGELFASDILEYIISSAEKIAADAFVNESAVVSYFGRARYNFRNKYIATFNIRYDGSSRFSNENKFGLFPSGDIVWRLSEEDFFNLKSINDLKLRVSYGVTGNDKIPDFLYIARYRTSEYNGTSAIYPVNISNPNLKWESTKQLNIGVDASTYNNRIVLSIDYYHKKTEDLLLNKPTPPSSGYSGIITNIGKLENRGIELLITTTNIKSVLHWESLLNVSANRNKVTELYNNQPIDNIGRGSQRLEVGEPIGIFYGYKSLGVDPSTGDLVFEDFYEDGIIDVRDKQKLGTPHPLFDGGLSNIFSYQNFELNFLLQFSYGNQIFNGTRRYIEAMKTNNQSVAVLDRWSQPGDITDIPRATFLDPNDNNRISSRFIEDGSYIKLKSIKLSYKFEERLLNRVDLSRLEIYIQAQNLFTWTKFSGMDPEVNYAGADAIRAGVEFFTYPTAKIYSYGLSVNF